MSARCKICHTEFVENEGDVCVSCMLGGGYSNAGSNTGTNISPSSTDTNIHGSTAIPKKSKPSAFGTARVKGTVQNYFQEPDNRSPAKKWFAALLDGTPYSSTDHKFIFDLKDDNVRNLDFGAQTGSSVVICGEITFGSINNNNVVEVYGDKTKHNVIAAKKIRNISNGSVINITKQISAAAVRLITLLIAILFVIFVVSAGFLIFNNDSTQSNNSGTSTVVDGASTGSDNADENTSGKYSYPVSDSSDNTGTNVNSDEPSSTVSPSTTNDSSMSKARTKDTLGKIGVIIVGALLILGGLKFGRTISRKTMFIVIGLGVACILIVFSPELFTTIVGAIIMFFIVKYLFKKIFR